MSSTLIVLLVEIGIVLLCIVALLFYLRWKKQRNKSIELGKMLDNFSRMESDRLSGLIRFFQEKQGAQAEDAEASAGYMVEAEKQFLQQFLKQQIEQTSIEDFYQNLIELLDQYLYFIPDKNSAEINNSDSGVDNRPQPGVIEDDAIAIQDVKIQQESAVDNEPEPEQKSDETATEIDENKQASEQQKTDTESSEEDTEAEPDWGDAFAESGDSVDEETKSSFDAEKKQQ